MHVVFPALRVYQIPFDALSEGLPSSYRVHIWYGKTRMAGLQSRKGRMMIDSVVSAQHINVTDTQTATETAHSHVDIAIAALTHCVARQKVGKIINKRGEG